MFFSGSMVTSPSWTVTLFLHSPNEATSHLMICIQSISGRFCRTFQGAKRSRLGSFPGKLSTIQYTILSAHCNTITYTGRSSCNLAIIADPDYVRRGSAHPYCLQSVGTIVSIGCLQISTRSPSLDPWPNPPPLQVVHYITLSVCLVC